MRLRWKILLAGATALSFGFGSACGAQSDSHSFTIEAQDLRYSLRDLARQSGLDLVAISDDLGGLTGPALRGDFTVQEAASRLLAGTGLIAEIKDGAIRVRGRSQGSAGTTSPDQEGQKIVVTGTRIRGAPPVIPVTELTSDGMRTAGQSNLGEAVRTLPQNFAGGQNPGVALGTVGATNQNINSASSLNLRGLGPDATLTLLNGHRLAYGSFVQAVDVNAIPLAAVDRVEVVADGASALYGSDAVGGVANIILKKDYEGLATSMRLAAATSGGDQQQQYNIVAGTRWSSGGIIATYDYEHDTAIRARQRDYMRSMPADNTVLPTQDRNSALLSAHQIIAPDVRFAIDALFNRRISSPTLIIPGSVRYESKISDRSYAISPTLTFDVSSAVTLSVNGVYGEDRTKTHQVTRAASGATTSLVNCYCNTMRSAEVVADGTLIDLSTGRLKFAVGGGYRQNGYNNYNTASIAVVDVRQNSYYGFGELYAPLVTPNDERRGLHSLSLSAAVRYEDYPGVDRVATPKIGLVYAPTGDLDVKGSWGRSFKAATLAQQYQPNYAYLYRATALGGVGYAATATALYVIGGNSLLKPEKASTWTATMSLHPRAVPDLLIEISYFSLHYRNRVTQPIQGTNFASSLSDSRYANFVSAFPSADAQTRLIAQAITGLNNLAGASYAAGNVVALVTNTYLNAASQHYQGVDLTGRYRFSTGDGSRIDLTAAGSWLDSTEQLDAAVPTRDLAGTIFNSPHVRARAGAAWKRGPLEAALFGNFTGGVTDTRSLPFVHVGSQTTADLSLHYRFEPSGSQRTFDVGLAVQNLLNDRPAYAKPAAIYYVPFDSTNQSAIGRFLSFTVAVQW